MKLKGSNLLIIFLIALIGCDQKVIITQKIAPYDARASAIKIELNEKLPQGVRDILAQEGIDKVKLIKFPVAYYLIPQENVAFMLPKNFNEEIASQLSLTVSGFKYYKLFVHPDSDKNYSFLKSAYRYIGPNQTEFVGSMLNHDRTLVLWSDRNLDKKAFIVKTKLDEKDKQEVKLREPASYYRYIPNIVNLIFHQPALGQNEKIEGQQVKEIPEISISK